MFGSACYASLSKWDQALKDASACVTKDPNFIKGYNRLATAQIGLKKYEEAVASIKKGLSKDPGIFIIFKPKIMQYR